MALSTKNELMAAKSLVAAKRSVVPPSTAPIAEKPIIPKTPIVRNLLGDEKVQGLVTPIKTDEEKAIDKFANPIPNGDVKQYSAYLKRHGATIDTETNPALAVGKGKQLDEWQSAALGTMLSEGRKRKYTPEQFDVMKKNILDELDKKGDTKAKAMNHPNYKNKESLLKAIASAYREQHTNEMRDMAAKKTSVPLLVKK